ncbi:hypothetical protein [Natrinema sp. SYSU A 869]|nr:hypothetical protein [Natrinema sp. SYSU A 869]
MVVIAGREKSDAGRRQTKGRRREGAADAMYLARAMAFSESAA